MGDWEWERNLHQVFNDADKDKSGYIGREDVLLMLLDREKHTNDPVFKSKLKFIMTCLEKADKDKDSKISFEEFKEYITKASST